ncbi:hypothetical protein CY35_04G135300 [Sphagnum magellanicum]|jgi:hypothetical protein|nr:hypothetical protein CY35_04G135200 [Sphagnum magellanicum]KAH9566586.1 hypothetical protein CY35_04G135300 [Sphagnum magellanicum]
MVMAKGGSLVASAAVAAILLIVCISSTPGVSATTHTFFVHDSILVPNANATLVAGPGGDLTQLQKGVIIVTDTAITATADPNSAQLGKFEGLYILDGGSKYRIEATIIFDFPLDLVESTFEVLGQRTSFNSTNDRQLAVVAGTGFFLGQTGFASVQTVSQTLYGTKGAQINTQQWILAVGK